MVVRGGKLLEKWVDWLYFGYFWSRIVNYYHTEKMRNYFKLIAVLLLAMTCGQQVWASFVGPRDDFRDESMNFVSTTRFDNG